MCWPGAPSNICASVAFLGSTFRGATARSECHCCPEGKGVFWAGVSGVGLQERVLFLCWSSGLCLGSSPKGLAGSPYLLGSPLWQSQTPKLSLGLVPWGKGRPGVPEATCSGCVRHLFSPPPANSQPVSGFLSVCPPQGGEGRLIGTAVWRRAPGPLGALRSDPRGLGVISPARAEGNPTWEPAAQGLLPSARQHQVRIRTFTSAPAGAP